MSLRAMIVDDEPLALERLRLCLEGAPGVELVGEASDGDMAARKIAELAPDLVMLDVQMPGRSGMAVARALSAQSQRPQVVFVTAFAEFAPEAFDLEAADYILKPVRYDRVQEAVRRAARRARAAAEPEAAAPIEPRSSSTYDAEMWIRRREGLVRVGVDQILRIEAARDYALIHTATRTDILRATMGDLEKRLDPAELLRVHRSAFVRPSSVVRVERNGRNLMRLHTADGAAVDVGASYARRVTAALRLSGAAD